MCWAYDNNRLYENRYNVSGTELFQYRYKTKCLVCLVLSDANTVTKCLALYDTAKNRD